MVPKTERNVIGNIPASQPSVSLDAVIRDLQDLRKNWISRKEMDAMKARMKKLESENSKLKADLANKEDKRLRYYNLYHENLKEVTEMKTENEALKAEIDMLKNATSEEENRVSEVSNSSFQSAVPVSESGSENEDEIPVAAPMLAICDGNVNSTTKRPRQADVVTDVAVKKPKIITDQPSWKCIVCDKKNVRFNTAGELRAHITTTHPSRTWFCERCPFSSDLKGGLTKHQRQHDANDLKYKGTDQARVCKLCNICYGNDSTLSLHYGMYH